MQKSVFDFQDSLKQLHDKIKLQQTEFEEIKKTEFAHVISNFDRLSDPKINYNNSNIIIQARDKVAEQILGKAKK